MLLQLLPQCVLTMHIRQSALVRAPFLKHATRAIARGGGALIQYSVRKFHLVITF